jgi:Folylpolyglutamate synthase
VAAFMAGRLPAGARLPVVLGLLADKDLAGVLACLSRLPCDINAVPIAGYNAHSADTISAAAQAAGLEAQAHPTVEDAVRAISGSATIALITGSLYLAGAVLRANGELPD